jgi:hypothetical protein
MSTRHPLTDHPKHVQAIGTIAIEAVALQVEMADLFGCMLSIPSRTARAIFMTPRTEQTRFDMLKNAATMALRPRVRNKDSEHEKRKAKALRRVLKLVSRAENAVRYRHRTVHDHWEVKGADVSRRDVDGTGKEGKPMPLQSLLDEIKKMRRLIDDVIDLTNEFSDQPPTLKDILEPEGIGLINSVPKSDPKPKS